MISFHSGAAYISFFKQRSHFFKALSQLLNFASQGIIVVPCGS